MATPEETARALSSLRKKRGVIKTSLTKLYNTLKILESTPDLDHAQRLVTKLESLDKDFRAIQFDIIDLLEEGSENVGREQDALDSHEDDVTSASLRLQKLVRAGSSPTATSGERQSSRKLTRLERLLQETKDVLDSIKEDHDDIALLEQYQEQVTDIKRELSSVYAELVVLDLPQDHALVKQHARLEKSQFDCSHHVKRLISSHASRPQPASKVSDGANAKLPKLDVPTFNGDVLCWQQFWEQFEVSIHSRKTLTSAEKLVYLQQAIKNGSARTSIEGLSRSGDQYEEAVSCLKGRFNRPRLIHRAHVRTIMEAPPMKEGSAKELRSLHDTLQQHLRALKSMKLEPDPSFITSIIELKLDATTLFEWQKHTQERVEDVPPYQDILVFLNLRAQASETLAASKKKSSAGSVTLFATADNDSRRSRCVACNERHPLYVCPKFRPMSHEAKVTLLKSNNICFNCFSRGHSSKHCKSLHKCKKCQKPHHTLLHVDTKDTYSPVESKDSPEVVSNAAIKLKSSSLLMTCKVFVYCPSGSSVEARALIDSASTSSFVSERLTQCLGLHRFHQDVSVSGIAGSLHDSPIRSVAHFQISSVHSQSKRRIDLTAIVLPKVTCNLPVKHVPFDTSWSHLSGLPLADPTFGETQRIDILLGVDVFVDILQHGRRSGPPGSPVAIETEFGWVLCGGTSGGSDEVNLHATAFHVQTLCGDELLRRFWEIEELPSSTPILSLEERAVVQHFEVNHSRSTSGRFIVPLPRKTEAKAIGESRSQAVRRFLSLERSLQYKGKFQEVNAVMKEYVDLGHAEIVPDEALDKDPASVFYLPMHVVYKKSSSTTKVRAVFDASAKSASGVSLNDTLLVGPTVHSTLVDVLLRFRSHRVAVTADVSKMYRAVELTPSDRDFHRFVWRSDPKQELNDFRMTRATFGVSASCFAANMAVKQNAIEFAHEYPLASEAVLKSFYVDDGLAGADNVEFAIILQRQLQDLFRRGGFMLRKWNSSEPLVLQAIWPELHEHKEIHSIREPSSHTKTLGVNWNTVQDSFHITVPELLPSDVVTKRELASDIAKVFDVLGWYAPATVTMKILLQKIWELGINWDVTVPSVIYDTWSRWRSELPSLSAKGIPRCYLPKGVDIVGTQLHGFSDASTDAYAGVVYLRLTDANGHIYVSLVMSKTKVSPIKQLTIPRLELCGAGVLARLLHKVKGILDIPLSDVYAWTDSTVVLGWLKGNPRRFKTYVGNRVSEIVDKIPPEKWRHVIGTENPADCASRGIFPSELVHHHLWWTGPPWLLLEHSQWPAQDTPLVESPTEEEKEVCSMTVSHTRESIVPLKHYSSFTHVQRVIARIFRFVNNCRSEKGVVNTSKNLTVLELVVAETYLVKLAQEAHFAEEVAMLKAGRILPRDSKLIPLHPFLDSDSVLRVGGREQNSKLSYTQMHPMILHGNHLLTKLIIRSEHLRLLHAGPTLVCSAIARRFYIPNMQKTVRSITRQCITCRRHSVKPIPQNMGQLPSERVTPGAVFEKVGIDYAGPVLVKYGMVRKPTVVKAYICVFVSLSVKAVHLEAVSNLTSEAFIATLRRFIARRGYPSLIWSDNGTNFVGANSDLKELHNFLNQQITKSTISDFCSSRKIEWRFIPGLSPHFGGLWEATVKSTKKHLKLVVGSVCLTFEELITVLAQIESCLNSRPLVPTNSPDDDGIEVLTPGHFLVGHSMCALPDPAASFRPVKLLRRWDLCQNLVRHFWRRWSSEYLTFLNKYNRWHHPTRNLQVGDIVVLHEDNMVPTSWPLARITEVHPGADGTVRVVTIKTSKGRYKRPSNKLALLLAVD